MTARRAHWVLGATLFAAVLTWGWRPATPQAEPAPVPLAGERLRALLPPGHGAVLELNVSVLRQLPELQPLFGGPEQAVLGGCTARLAEGVERLLVAARTDGDEPTLTVLATGPFEVAAVRECAEERERAVTRWLRDARSTTSAASASASAASASAVGSASEAATAASAAAPTAPFEPPAEERHGAFIVRALGRRGTALLAVRPGLAVVAERATVRALLEQQRDGTEQEPDPLEAAVLATLSEPEPLLRFTLRDRAWLAPLVVADIVGVVASLALPDVRLHAVIGCHAGCEPLQRELPRRLAAITTLAPLHLEQRLVTRAVGRELHVDLSISLAELRPLLARWLPGAPH